MGSFFSVFSYLDFFGAVNIRCIYYEQACKKHTTELKLMRCQCKGFFGVPFFEIFVCCFFGWLVGLFICLFTGGLEICKNVNKSYLSLGAVA